MSFLHEILGGDAAGRPTVSLVIHRSQLLWRVSSLDSWFLDKAHMILQLHAEELIKPWLNKHFFYSQRNLLGSKNHAFKFTKSHRR